MIKPRKIFMGEKDYQQIYLVKKYFHKKNSDTIISCKTVIDNYKLALSSINFHLNKKELNQSRLITKNLHDFQIKLLQNKKIKKLIFQQKKKYKN